MSYADELLQEVSTYLSAKDVEHIRQAYELSRAAHEGQFRRSGDPYITHPVAVARILTPMHLDALLADQPLAGNRNRLFAPDRSIDRT